MRRTASVLELLSTTSDVRPETSPRQPSTSHTRRPEIDSPLTRQPVIFDVTSGTAPRHKMGTYFLQNTVCNTWKTLTRHDGSAVRDTHYCHGLTLTFYICMNPELYHIYIIFMVWCFTYSLCGLISFLFLVQGGLAIWT